MKNPTLLPAFFLFSFVAFGQVGINTDNPTSTLDVNGSLRVRDHQGTSLQEVVATRIIGVDDNGNFTNIEIGENIILEDNTLRILDRTLRIGDIPELTTTQNNNISLIIWPGGGNDDKSIIRIRNTFGTGDTEITGIADGTDGMHIWLYAVTGKLDLVPNSPLSLPQNQIMPNDKMKAKQYEMIELFYDGTLQKWIVMQNHQ